MLPKKRQFFSKTYLPTTRKSKYSPHFTYLPTNQKTYPGSLLVTYLMKERRSSAQLDSRPRGSTAVRFPSGYREEQMDFKLAIGVLALSIAALYFGGNELNVLREAASDADGYLEQEWVLMLLGLAMLLFGSFIPLSSLKYITEGPGLNNWFLIFWM